MISEKALAAAKAAYDIERDCIEEMKAYFDDEAFSKAVTLLKNAPRIGTTGCGHSGLICQHIAHLLNCIERPAAYISPAVAIHGSSGFLQPGDVMIFASRGGKTKDFPLFGPESRFTDDTVMTLAVADALMDSQGKGEAGTKAALIRCMRNWKK